jgi:ATP-dependent helicase/nuclease subunit A
MNRTPDAQARSLAATTFDRNVVVTASAGTGKTTLLITRLVHLLVKSPDPVPLSQIVALTFMNKAANEIKIRLRECLEGLLAPGESPASRALWDHYRLSSADLADRYRLSADELRTRAEAAIRDLENSQIGTIHSFAAHLLRLYPLEAGVDPGFQTDEGLGFDEHFTHEWSQWLDVELGARGPRQALWKKVLRGADLEALQSFARALVNDLIPLATLAAQVSSPEIDETVRLWLEEKRRRALALIEAHREKKPRQVEQLLDAAGEVFGRLLKGGAGALRDLPEERRTLLASKQAGSKPPAGWADEEFEDASAVIRTAKALLESDQDYVRALLELVLPFAESCRRRFIEAGSLTFDGLLARARDLLKTHRHVRARLKRRFRALLVDEFQDTDPVQYEILLFLAEREEESAEEWQQVRLHPGKLFIVGDPKQSIFAFRRADIEAFQKVTRMVADQNGCAFTLRTNFRSHPTILSAVNGVFDRLIRERPGLQPRYEFLEPDPDRKTKAGTQGVELRLVAASGEGDEESFTAEQAVEAEAEAVARWLKQDLIGKEVLTERDGRRRAVEPGDVAILFRTFTQSWDYLGALRRRGLPYVAEGEKHFYQRQEVIDLVNLLSAIQNPHDQVALAGVLRSAVGALTDRDLMALAAAGPFEYRGADAPALDAHPRGAHLRRLYAVLESLHRDCPARPLPDALDLVFERLPVLELAAACSHGEQAVANLWKVRALADDVVADPNMTMAAFVTLLKARLADPPDESESGLSEETSRDAVRVMSMHKAKGLEFPIVILVGLQAGTKPQYDPILVQQDWSTGVVGVRLGDRRTLGGVYVAEKLEARIAAERRRLLYVGMTRAKERLVLSGALTRRQTEDTFLAMLRDAVGEAVGKAEVAAHAVGEGRISQTIVPPEERKPGAPRKDRKDAHARHDLAALEARWRARGERWDRSRRQSAFLTPTQLLGVKEPLVSGLGGKGGRGGGERASFIGTIVHNVLETWNYDENPHAILEQTFRALDRWIPEDLPWSREEIRQEIRDVLKGFVESEALAELRSATILGREVPFMMRWEEREQGPPPALMEGRIDLIYETDGRVWAADYKTDRVSEADSAGRATTYRVQAQIYSEAVSKALGRELGGFKIIFVRLGKAVAVAL